MTVPFKKNVFANRGKKAEDAVQKALTQWALESPNREFNRLVDSKAAGRTIKAAAADFEYFYLEEGYEARHSHGLIEVKETQHEYRLARDKVPQLARLRKRSKCGGFCFVLVLHSTTGLWRVLTVRELTEGGDKGSWDLREYPTHTSATAALEHADWAFTLEAHK